MEHPVETREGCVSNLVVGFVVDGGVERAAKV